MKRKWPVKVYDAQIASVVRLALLLRDIKRAPGTPGVTTAIERAMKLIGSDVSVIWKGNA